MIIIAISTWEWELATLLSSVGLFPKEKKLPPGQRGSVGWCIVPWTKSSQVQFLVRAHI